MRVRRVYVWAAVAVVGVGAVAWLGRGLGWGRAAADPLPTDDEVERVVATVPVGDGGKKVRFDLPAGYWARVRAALSPATRDRDPAKWVGLGSLDVTRRDGQIVHVALYRSPEPPGAFAAGPTFQDRVYYRGGDSDELLRVLVEAHQAAQR